MKKSYSITPFHVFVLLSVIIAIVLSLMLLNRSHSAFGLTAYDNYLIFRQSFHHLVANKDIYQHFTTEHADVFKYTPTFSFFMAPFAYMPVWLGLILWNMLGAVMLAFSLKAYFQKAKQVWLLYLLVIAELATNVLSCQSNSHITAMLLFGFTAFQNKSFTYSSFWFLLATFIKPFAIVFFVFYLFYPRYLVKNSGVAILIFLSLLFIPSLAVGLNQLQFLYTQMFARLQQDHGQLVKLCFAGWANAWAGTNVSSTVYLILGLIVQLFATWKGFKTQAYLVFAQWLMWIVLFNHMAESSTFIIAVSAAAIWFSYASYTKIQFWILWSTILIFTCLGPTDIFPVQWRQTMVYTLQLKAFAIVLLWLVSLVQTFRPQWFKPIKINA